MKEEVRMSDRRFGGFWRRLLAYAIDKVALYVMSLLLFIVGLLAMELGGVSIGNFAMTGDLPRGTGLFMAIFLVTAFLMNMTYFIWFHGTVGQTLGKRVFGIRVVQVSGEKMTLGIAFLRWAGSLVSGIFISLGFIWIALDGRKQGWHDKIAATLVVYSGNEPEAPPKAQSLGSQLMTQFGTSPMTAQSVPLTPITEGGISDPSRSDSTLMSDAGLSERSAESLRDCA